MEITLEEMQKLLDLSRAQISRYASDGRLTRTRQGFYDPASVANLRPLFDCFDVPHGSDLAEQRELFNVQAKHEFKRDMVAIFQKRHEASGKWGRVTLTAEQERELDKAVEVFGKAIAAMPGKWG